jgi:O-antigen ligase
MTIAAIELPVRPDVRGRVAQGFEVVAIALFSWLAFNAFFSLDRSFDRLAVVASAVAIGAAVLRRDSWQSGFDWPLGAYLACLALAALVHDGMRPAGSIEMLRHAIVLAVFTYALAFLLRTPQRLACAAAFLVLAVHVIGFQATAYHVATGFDGRPGSYPIVRQWSGYPEIGLLTTVAVAFPAALVVAGPSVTARIVAFIVAAILALYTLALFSRSADATLVITKRRRWVLFAMAVSLTAIELLFIAKSDTLSYFLSGDRVSMDAEVRWQVWSGTLAMVRAHPWFGVGAGNYADGLRATHLSRFDVGHAHNMLLHIAAESGVPAMLAFAWLWAAIFRNVWRLWRSTAADPIVIGIFGALAAFFVRTLTDHFFAGLDTSNRMSFVLYALFGMAAAAHRVKALPPEIPVG